MGGVGAAVHVGVGARCIMRLLGGIAADLLAGLIGHLALKLQLTLLRAQNLDVYVELRDFKFELIISEKIDLPVL